MLFLDLVENWLPPLVVQFVHLRVDGVGLASYYRPIDVQRIWHLPVAWCNYIIVGVLGVPANHANDYLLVIDDKDAMSVTLHAMRSIEQVSESSAYLDSAVHGRRLIILPVTPLTTISSPGQCISMSIFSWDWSSRGFR